MKTVLRLEELMKFLLAYILTLYLGFEWWLFLALLLAPDISMLAYLINTRTGAVFYNIFHHQGIAVITGLAGLFINNNDLFFAGLLLFGHSSMDRVLVTASNTLIVLKTLIWVRSGDEMVYLRHHLSDEV